MRFSPEDDQLGGPRCRNCHKGSSGCGGCHNTGDIVTSDEAMAADNSRNSIVDFLSTAWKYAGMPAYSDYDGENAPYTLYKQETTSDGQDNELQQEIFTQNVSGQDYAFIFKESRTINWDTDWRTTTTDVGNIGDINGSCADDGFSWPHRTLGWKMLKDDLFGLDFVGPGGGEYDWGTVTRNPGVAANDGIIEVGENRTYYDADGNPTSVGPAHDIDSVCLDCHNPTIWNATSADHTDGAGTADDYNDELLLRGLP